MIAAIVVLCLVLLAVVVVGGFWLLLENDAGIGWAMGIASYDDLPGGGTVRVGVVGDNADYGDQVQMTHTPMFSLLHTTARVPGGWVPACRAWLDGCANPRDVEYVLCTDAGVDLAEVGREATRVYFGSPLSHQWGQISWAVNFGEKCSTAGWNSAAQASTGKVLVCIADDLFPSQHAKWDEELRKVFAEQAHMEVPMDLPLVINPDFGSGIRRDCISFSICTRARYAQLGYVVNPEYGPMYPDDDWAMESYRDGVVVEAPQIKWEHRWLGTDHDEVYRRQNDPANYARGWEVFKRRWPAEAARRNGGQS